MSRSFNFVLECNWVSKAERTVCVNKLYYTYYFSIGSYADASTSSIMTNFSIVFLTVSDCKDLVCVCLFFCTLFINFLSGWRINIDCIYMYMGLLDRKFRLRNSMC